MTVSGIVRGLERAESFRDALAAASVDAEFSLVDGLDAPLLAALLSRRAQSGRPAALLAITPTGRRAESLGPALGALVPEALEAAAILDDAEVVCITSADLLFRSFQARSGFGDGHPDTLTNLFPPGVPIVSLVDGHPHTLAFLGSPITCLGVQRFGQAGDILELYEHHEIDAESVVGAALDLLG